MTITKKALKEINSSLNAVAVAHMMIESAKKDNDKSLILLWAEHGLNATNRLNKFGIQPDASNGDAFKYYVNKYSHLELA
jgi:hypothetical protein